MTAQISKTKIAFELPRQTYINLRLEEPGLYAPDAPVVKPGLFARLTQRLASFRAWHEQAAQAAELRGMTDRELADIGISRGDIDQFFSADRARDLRTARTLMS